jgi:hypothetical protein
MLASMAFFLCRPSPAGAFWNVLGNSLPESAQGFLTLVRVEYYDAATLLPGVLFNFASKILKTS